MKKYFKNYAIIWLVGVVIFSAIVFAIRTMSTDIAPSPTFIIAYVVTLAAFAGQLAVAYKFFSEENKDRIFLNIPIIRLANSGTLFSVIAATALMVIPGVPYFIAPIVVVIVLGIFVAAIAKASMAADAVEAVEKKVAVQTSFIKEMTVKAEGILANAKSDNAKAAANKVYEAFRYSNKSSHGGLEEVEGKINANLSVFSDAISTGDDDMANSISENLLKLIAERNNIAKLNK